MDKFFQNLSEQNSEHPSPELLLLMVDGELQLKEAAHLEGHLEACWPCRVKTQKIHDAIVDIIEFDDQVLTPHLSPPKNWHNFDRKLSQVVADSGKQSFSSRLFGSLGRIVPSSHLVASSRLFNSSVLRVALVIVSVLVIFSLLMRLGPEPTVSASQLLHKSIQAEALRGGSITDPVVHQKLHITRKDQTSEHALNLDVWQEANNTRIRQFIASTNKMLAIGSDKSTGEQMNSSDRDLISDLQTVLKANHMDPVRPLSATSYQSWHNTLKGQHDEIIKARPETISLHTNVAEPIGKGQISEATLLVRAADWLPAELNFIVKTENGSCSYQLTETASEVVKLSDVNSTIFSDQPVPITSPKVDTKEDAKPSPTAAVATTALPLTATTATADLEVEALYLLHEANADLGEQISVQRNVNGQLAITGIVETDQRKKAIVQALASLAPNSAVRIDIQTVAEAVAQQEKTRAKATPAPVTEQEIEISKTTAASSDLRRHFESDEQMRQFASRMVGLSSGAMSHIYALKSLIGQFTPESLRTLTPEARAKWLQLIRSHAQAYETNLQTLRLELQRVFPAKVGSGAIDVAAISDDASLTRAIEGLYAAASGIDLTIHSVLTASSESGPKSVINLQFWNQLNAAEAFAARLAQVQ